LSGVRLRARAAHLAARAREAEHRPLRMLARRARHCSFDAEPVAHLRHVAEGHPRLCHAERSRVHAEEDHALGRVCVGIDVGVVRAPRVLERIVDVCHRGREAQIRHVTAQAARCGAEFRRDAIFHRLPTSL
jgi:hypothetical protein